MIVRFALLLLACGLAGALPAQGRGAPKTAEAALAAFERDKTDPKKRTSAARALAEFADADVTRAILDALVDAEEPGFRAVLADALGALERDDVLVPLEELWLEAPGSPSLRRAAAKGLARQGDACVAVLAAVVGEQISSAAVAAAEGAEKTRLADVRLAGIAGLALAGGERAWPALGAVVASGALAERKAALAALESSLPSPDLTAALLEAATDDNLEVAARAARVLGLHDHPRTKDVVLKIHRKLKAQRSPRVTDRVALVRALALVLDHRDAFEPFIRQASYSDADVADAVEKLRAEVTAHEPFRRWLITRGMQRSDELERCLVIRLLTHAPETRVTPMLLRAMRDRDLAIVLTAARALAERGDREAVPELRRYLAGPGGERRLEALFALHRLLEDDPDWERQLLAEAQSPDRAVRAAVFDFLAELGSRAGLELVWNDLDDRSWAVRAAAYDYCKRVRVRDSIPLLIERVDEESGRLREDVLDALQSLTARRYPTTERWQSWWRDHGAGFEPVPLDEVEKPKKRDSDRTVTYYDIPLVSKRVTFVVDVSGSMKATIGTARKRSRLDEAKRQLRNVVENITKDTRFNIVSFDHRASALFDELQRGTKGVRKEALASVDELKAAGGTNIYAAMRLAFDDPAVDTIYLLSDGYPSGGEIQDAEALADEIRRWNRTRQLRIHCIAIGSNSKLLRRVAAESGGTYANFR